VKNEFPLAKLDEIGAILIWYY